MARPSRVCAAAAVVTLAGALTGFAWLVPAAGAAPAPTTPASGSPAPSGSAPSTPSGTTAPSCAVSGYPQESAEQSRELRRTLLQQTASDLGGTRLERADTWVVPTGGHSVMVVDSATPLTEGSARVFLFGLDFPLKSGTGPARDRYVSITEMPHLGSTVRVVGLRAGSNACGGDLVLMADRGVFATRLGQAGLLTGALFGVLTVLVARRRRGGWLRRFLLSAPLGLLAGAGEAALLQESGSISPFSRATWAVPVLGLLLAALLPLTRRRRTPAASPGQPTGGAPWLAPAHVPLGAYRADAPFTRTAVAQVDRGTHLPTGERVLLKAVLPERAADPEAAARLSREADTLSSLDDPNCLRVREVLPTPAGPPVLVFEDVDGVTARRVLAERGPLTGPQACTVLTGVLAGLAAVHEAGIVHRDVRPDNIYLDAGGRVLLAGFELGAPGGDNAVVAEGVPPYAGPQQRRGEPVDGRADLWSAAAVLAELLTGTVPVVAEDTGQVLLPSGDGELPAPIADLVTRAMATDPQARPGTAAELRTALREAAAEAYGPDWMTLGALTGVVVLPGGVLAASTLAGAAGAAGLAVTGTTATSAAGFGAATPVALAPAGGAGAGMAQAASTVTTVTGAVTTPAGKVGLLVTPVLAIATVAVVGLSGTAGAAPRPAAEVITPEAARVIFVRTVAEARGSSLVHIAEPIRVAVGSSFRRIFPDAGRQLTGIAVGVPRDQRGYPAHFVATAHVLGPGGTTYLLTRFDRAAADQPWRMSSLRTWDDRVVAAPKLDPDGYLAPAPAVADLLADPARLPGLYLDWLRRSMAVDTVVADPLLALAPEASYLRGAAGWDHFSRSAVYRRQTSWRYGAMNEGAVSPDLIPFEDGTVLATFDATVHQTIYNRAGHAIGSCDRLWLTVDVRPGGRYRKLDIDWAVHAQAWVPVRGAVTAPGVGPAATSPAAPATPTPTAGTAPRPVPVATDRITIDDSWYDLNVTANVPC